MENIATALWYAGHLAFGIDTMGGIPTVRVSSAQSATKYPYWGASRGIARRTSRGHVAIVQVERASSDRRSERLAVDDALKIAASERSLYVGNAIGRRIPDATGLTMVGYVASAVGPSEVDIEEWAHV